MSNGLLTQVDSVGGVLLNSSGLGTATALSAAATWQAFSVMTERAVTLNTIRFNVSSVTGTPGANLQVHLYSDLLGVPNASLGSITVTPVTGWVTASGFSIAMSANTMYWVVFKNLNGTPASNFPSITNFLGLKQNITVAPVLGTTWGWGIKKGTINSGTAWATSVAAGRDQPVRLGFADGSFIGTPYSASAFSTVLTTDIYAKRAAGMRVTVPANFRGNVIGVMAPARKQGTPTGDLLVKAYKNQAYGALPATPDATSNSVPLGNVGTGAGEIVPFLFPAALAIVGGDVVDFFLRNSNDVDTSANSYRSAEATYDTDADSTPLLGDWTPRAISTTDDSSVIPSLTASTVFSMALLLQSGSTYNAAGAAVGYRVKQRVA